MEKTVGIYIPTLNRVNKQLTYEEFMIHKEYIPTLVCPLREQGVHRRKDRKYKGCPKSGIGKVRQWILEKAEEDIVIMIDDDMNFQYRPNPNSTRLEQLKKLSMMINHCVSCVNRGYIHGGVSSRQGNNNMEEDEYSNKRVCNFHFLDRKSILKTGARFDQLPVMEDFHFILTLLTAGYENRAIYKYSWNQRGGSVGGCNTYRTLDLQAEAAEELQKQFPEFVTVVIKKSKGWSIAEGERKDVRVQWQKAYRSSQ